MLGSTTRRAVGSNASQRRLRVVGIAVAIATAVLIGTSGTTLAWSTGSFSSSDEKKLFSLTNRDRAAAGLNALTNDSFLHSEAEWRAKDMGNKDYFSHSIPPGGKKVFYYMSKAGYCYQVAGENIGLSNYDDDVATTSIEEAFMGSPTHRANILGKWTKLGVGAYKAPNGNKLYAVLFSIPCPKAAAKPKATAKPTLAPTPSPTDSPTPMPTDTPEPTVVPTEVPEPGPSSSPEMLLDGATSLRVHEQTVSQGPVDSLFHSLFGGLFGW
jgi:uncharacterized protein YkwD